MELFPETSNGDVRERLETACQNRQSESVRFRAEALSGIQVHLIVIPIAAESMEAIVRWAPPQAVLTWEQRLLFDGDVMEWLLDHSRDMVLIVSPIFEVMYFNQPAEAFIRRYFESQIQIGDDFWPYVPPSNQRTFLEKVNQAFAGEVVYWPERKVPLFNQEIRWMSSTFFPVRNQAGRMFGVALLYHDIHQEKLIREEIDKQNEKLAHISFNQYHRIRRHVANQLALIDMILGEAPEGDNLRLLNLLKHETQRLDEVIHQITDEIYS